MKPKHFLSLLGFKQTSLLLLIVLLFSFSFCTEAKSRKHKAPPKTEIINPEPESLHPELDLSIPDQWYENEAPNSDPFQKQAKTETPQIISKKTRKKPVNVDCGMDVNPNLSIDNSIGSRLTGECDLQYRY